MFFLTFKFAPIELQFRIFELHYCSKLRFSDFTLQFCNESTWRIWTNRYCSYVGGNLLGAGVRSPEAMDEEHDQSQFRMGRLLDLIDLGNSFSRKVVKTASEC